MSCYPIQRCAAVRPKRSLSLFVWLVSLDGCSEQRWSVIAAELELCSESSLRRATTSFVAISAEQNTCRLRSCCMAISNVMLRLDHARIPAFCFFWSHGIESTLPNPFEGGSMPAKRRSIAGVCSAESSTALAKSLTLCRYVRMRNAGALISCTYG